MSNSIVARIIGFIQLGRPHFLIGGVVFNALGVAMAYYRRGSIDWNAVVFSQALISCTQLMVHYGNDFFDYAADTANTSPTLWSGGSRILQRGYVPRRAALITSVILGSIAIVLALIVAVQSLWMGAMLLLVILLAWSYSAPPLDLHGNGWGEITAMLIVALMTPVMAYMLQTKTLVGLPLLALLPLCLLQLNMLLTVELPDAASDYTVGRRNWVTLLGAGRTRTLYLVLLVSAYGLLFAGAALGLPRQLGWLMLLVIPVALWHIWQIRTGLWQDSTRWNWLGFTSISLLLGTAVLEIVAFVWAAQVVW